MKKKENKIEENKEEDKNRKIKEEEIKVNMRNARRDCLERLKALKKNGDISEDELGGLEKKVQSLLDDYIAKIDDALANKEKEIMEI